MQLQNKNRKRTMRKNNNFMFYAFCIMTFLCVVLCAMLYLYGVYNEVEAVAKHTSPSEFDSYWVNDFCRSWHSCEYENDSYVPYKDLRGEK